MNSKQRLKAVRELHAYSWQPRDRSKPPTCLECGQHWPCQSYLITRKAKRGTVSVVD